VSDPTPASTQPTARRLTDMVIEKFGAAFAKASTAAGSLRITWDVYPVASPNPMMSGQVVTGLAVFCSISSTLIGRYLALTAAVDGTIVEEGQETVDQFVQDRVGELLAARREEVAQAQQQAARQQAEANGHPPVPDGLIVPGR
jgi:hypothetical protein